MDGADVLHKQDVRSQGFLTLCGRKASNWDLLMTD
jgi:hypothetical protein